MHVFVIFHKLQIYLKFSHVPDSGDETSGERIICKT